MGCRQLPVTQYMIANKTFEKFASDAGYDLTVDYRDYPSALPMVEAFVSGNLDFGMWGNTPIVRMIAQNQPIHLLSVGEGHFRFVLATRNESPIRSIQDLKGKTVGTLLGGDPYNAFSQMLRYEMGNPDPRAFDITVVNTPTQAQAATIPTGMDAAVLIHPAFLKANAELGTAGIMNSFGYTGPITKDRPAKGAGLLESVKKSALLSGRLLPASLVLDRRADGRQGQSRRRDGVPDGAAGCGGQAFRDAAGAGVGALKEILGARSRTRREGRQRRRAVRARLVLAHRR